MGQLTAWLIDEGCTDVKCRDVGRLFRACLRVFHSREGLWGGEFVYGAVLAAGAQLAVSTGAQWWPQLAVCYHLRSAPWGCRLGVMGDICCCECRGGMDFAACCGGMAYVPPLHPMYMYMHGHLCRVWMVFGQVNPQGPASPSLRLLLLVCCLVFAPAPSTPTLTVVQSLFGPPAVRL